MATEPSTTCFLPPVQHLRDAGKLEETPKDIGALIKEVQADIAKEETDNIKEALFGHFWPQIQRGVIRGLPEWYKAQLGFSELKEAA